MIQIKTTIEITMPNGKTMRETETVSKANSLLRNRFPHHLFFWLSNNHMLASKLMKRIEAYRKGAA